MFDVVRPAPGSVPASRRTAQSIVLIVHVTETAVERFVIRRYSWVLADVSSQVPEALWPRARGAIRYYAEGRDAGAGTPQYEHAQEIANAFNRHILGYDREMKRRYPGGRAEILAEEQLEQHKLSNAIALAQVSFPYSWLTSLVLR